MGVNESYAGDRPRALQLGELSSISTFGCVSRNFRPALFAVTAFIAVAALGVSCAAGAARSGARQIIAVPGLGVTFSMDEAITVPGGGTVSARPTCVSASLGGNFL
jgi:hypothetical protein